jgi:hypothetical protein
MIAPNAIEPKVAARRAVVPQEAGLQGRFVANHPALGARCGPVLRLARAARVIDQDLDGLNENLRFINKALYLVVIRQVADDNVGTSALSDNIVGDFLGLGSCFGRGR